MNKIDLDTIGVQELCKEELMSISGGDGDRPFGRPDYIQPDSGGSSEEKDECSVMDILILIFAGKSLS